MVEHIVHVPSQELILIRVAEEPDARRVGEGAGAPQVNPINPLGRGIEQEPDVFFALAESFLSPVAFDTQGDFGSIGPSVIHGPIV
jgi:hypothetical protein